MTTTASVARDKTTARNEGLDFTKGALVLLMVVYHWLNYFVVVEYDVYRYLRFLTPSFIFITGFLVSQAYLSKYAATDRRLHLRLLTRGVKLLLLFSVLNLVANVILTQNLDGTPLGVRTFFQSAYGIYVEGTGKAAFDAIVPIGYFLILTPGVLLVTATVRLPLMWMGVLAVLTTITADRFGLKNVNVQLISIAVLGLGLGTLPLNRINSVARHGWAIAFVYAIYVAAISVWNILFPLQVVGVCLSVLLIYAIGSRPSRTAAHKVTVELGKYSLFAYIAHLIVLQLLRRGLVRFDLRAAGLLAPFLIALFLTISIVLFVAAGRRRSGVVDQMYRVVFA